MTWIEKMVNSYFASVPRYKPHVKNVNNALLIAHRGAHNNTQNLIENTLEAFRLAKESGCWGIEFDVRATADNILIVNHDSTLNRLWGHDVAIADLTFSQLRALEPGVPSLAEVLAEFGGTMHLFIELKAPFKDEDALVNTLQGLTPCEDYHLLTLEAATCTYLSKFPKQALLLVAVHNNVKEFCEISLKNQYGGVLGNYLLLTNKLMNKLKDANQVSGVGFVDSKNSLYRELKRGIKWIFTNKAKEISFHLQHLQ